MYKFDKGGVVIWFFFLNLMSGDNPYKVDVLQINQRASLLQRYLCDEEKELQALYALQALMVHMEQPASECCPHNLLQSRKKA